MPCPPSHGPWPSPPEPRNLGSSEAPNIQTSDYRVGAPVPLPPPSMRPAVDGDEASERLIEHFRDNFTEKASEVLETHKVEWKLLDFRVARPGNHREPTLQIIPDWQPPATIAWQAAVSDIKEHIDRELSNAGLLDGSTTIIVEIMDSLILEPKIVGPILTIRSSNYWIRIRERVFSILQSFKMTEDATTTISIFRYGHSQDTSRDPIVVFIALDDYNSNIAAWEAAELLGSDEPGTYHRYQPKVRIQEDRYMQTPYSSECVFMPHQTAS
ncbi:uncharacterized protein DNG_09154 [Cephalotrichum gorgonifer]|uniref:Uncharacterized protein n=1 Tax=Cephalotrichum gorgonifer TaxID=2041049 RepID=A0AAE8SZ36_9PEZI|nr:uncharacterized protein DNG_09154 [Cephalotrichum gorgonifer]